MRKLLLIPVVLLVLASCEQEDDFIGPSSCDQFCNFRIKKDFSHDQSDGVDFSFEAVVFDALFSNSADWTIQLEGMNSGATKTLSGTSEALNAENATWDGKSDGRWFESEEVSVTMAIEGFDDTIRSSLEVVQPFTYSDKGVVVAPFKGTQGVTVYGGATSSQNSVDGDGALKLEGIEGGGQWWLGGLAISQSGYVDIVNINPEEVFFNCYVFGTGSAATKLTITFLEDDDDDFQFNKAVDDGYEYPIQVTWEGWKLVSFPLSTTVEMTDAGQGFGNGNHVKNIDKIKMMEFQLFSNGTADPDPKAVIVDYAIITEGSPL